MNNFYLFLILISNFVSCWCYAKVEIQSPLGSSLVVIGSSYQNQCESSKVNCNAMIQRLGYGLIFKVSLNENHYFVATTSHLTQGLDLKISSHDQKITYSPKKYLIDGNSQFLRLINNDDDLEVIEIEDPKLNLYFEYKPIISNSDPQKNTGINVTSNQICINIESNSKDLNSDDIKILKDSFIPVNIDHTYIHLSRVLPILNLINPFNFEFDIKKKLLPLISAILINQNGFSVLNPLDSSFAYLDQSSIEDFRMESQQILADGSQQMDISNGFNRAPEFSWNLNEMLLKHFIFRGQSGTPIFFGVSDSNAELSVSKYCLFGLVKGFHRYFKRAYTTDVDGNSFISNIHDKLKSIEENDFKSLRMTEIYGNSFWYMKDNETFRKYKNSKNLVYSELASWYGPSGGGETADGGGSIKTENESIESKSFKEILSQHHSPGVNLGHDIIVGIDITEMSGTRNLYANLASLKFLESTNLINQSKMVKIQDLENPKTLTERIKTRLNSLEVYQNQIKLYQATIMKNVIKAKSDLSFRLGLFYLFADKEQVFSDDKSGIFKIWSNDYFSNSRALKKSIPNYLNLINHSDDKQLSDCRVKIKNNNIVVRVSQGYNFLNKKTNAMSEFKSEDKNYLTIILNSKFQTILWEAQNGTFLPLNTDTSNHIDLKPKIFIKAGDEKNFRNLLIVDLKGLLFFDFNLSGIQLTANQDQIESYNILKKRLPLLIDGPFDQIIDESIQLRQYSPEATVFSKVAHIILKPIGSEKEFTIPCHPDL